ncbi:MAG: DHHW family protein [Oscillospiraceae bacterium]|nr:DHHW family protein [Oscillospiraceae bacterium]
MRYRKKRKNENKKKIIPILGFLVPLAFLSISHIIHSDSEISEEEKRTLAQKPSFSFSSYFSGEFTKEYGDYFQDQFPFRNFFMNTNKKIMAFYTETNKNGVEIVDVKKPDMGFGEALPPANTTSYLENTTSYIENTTSSKTDNTTEKVPYIPPPKEVQDMNSILIADNRAMEYFGIDELSLLAYADSINTLQKNVPGVQVYDLLVPSPIEFYSPAEYHTGTHSEKAAIKIIHDALKDVKSVDAYSKISYHIDEYLYFRTDHHWTARGAYYSYVAFADSAGFDAVDINKLKKGQIDNFLGSLYYYTLSQKLANNPDYVEYFIPEVSNNATVYQDSSMQDGYPIDVITTNVQSTNKYLVFITGDVPLIHINTELKNGKKILVVKESFGNAFVPFLVNNYEDIYVLDPRSLIMNIPKFVKDHGILEIMCINSIYTPSNPTWMNGFNSCIINE